MASEDTTATDDAPLIDLNEASIKKLIAKAKRRGYITVDELNEALPQDQMSSEQIEDVMSAISEMGVNIVETDEDAAEEDAENDGDDAEEASSEDGSDGDDSGHVPEKKKKETTERTDDPVRNYLADVYTLPASLAGLPGLSMPAGFGVGGRPVGLQLIGRWLDEARLLNVAHRFQQATDWHLKVPA